jgi:hypothetical protein
MSNDRPLQGIPPALRATSTAVSAYPEAIALGTQRRNDRRAEPAFPKTRAQDWEGRGKSAEQQSQKPRIPFLQPQARGRGTPLEEKEWGMIPVISRAEDLARPSDASARARARKTPCSISGFGWPTRPTVNSTRVAWSLRQNQYRASGARGGESQVLPILVQRENRAQPLALCEPPDNRQMRRPKNSSPNRRQVSRLLDTS